MVPLREHLSTQEDVKFQILKFLEGKGNSGWTINPEHESVRKFFPGHTRLSAIIAKKAETASAGKESSKMVCC